VRRAAPLPRAVAGQAMVELRLTLRRGENLLAMLGIPAALLLFLGGSSVLPAPVSGTRVDRLLPGILALAILATGLVNLGIATAYERTYGVLKRLGGSPLGRSGLVVAKILSVLMVEIALVVILVGLAATVLGWRPSGDVAWPAVLVAVALGTAAFAGWGLVLAGALRAETVLVLANILFLALMGLGGVVVPAADLPGPAGSIAALLPSGALTAAIRSALEGGAPVGIGPWAVLSAWAAGALAVAARTFRWD
jgi:ABC-2 type transport system permease protein